MHNFTPNDLLLYVLNEANSDTSIAIEKAIQTDSAMKTELRNLKLTIDEIDQFKIEPDEKVMNFILQDLFVSENEPLIV